MPDPKRFSTTSHEEEKRRKRLEHAKDFPTAFPGKKFKSPKGKKSRKFATPKEVFEHFFKTKGKATSKFPPSRQEQTRIAEQKKFEARKALINPAWTKWDKRETEAIKQIDDKYHHLRHSNPRKGADAIALWKKQNPAPPKMLKPSATPEIKGIEEKVDEARKRKKEEKEKPRTDFTIGEGG